LQPGDIVRRPKRETMGRLLGDRIEQAIDILRFNRTVGDPSLRGRDLDQRSQPVQPTRSGPDDIEGEVPFVPCSFESRSYLLRADSKRSGVARDEQAKAHRLASTINVSSLRSFSRPTTAPSSIALGATAHSPRQYT